MWHLLRTHYTSGEDGHVFGALLNINKDFKKELADLRQRQRTAKAELVVYSYDLVWITDGDLGGFGLDEFDEGDSIREMDDNFDLDERGVEKAEGLGLTELHVGDKYVYWSVQEKYVAVSYETCPLTYEELGLPAVAPARYNTLEKIYDAQVKLWSRERKLGRNVPRAMAKIIRSWLATRPETKSVFIDFEESEDIGAKVMPFVSARSVSGKPVDINNPELEDALTSFPVFDATFEPHDFICVTRNKIYVKKGWKERCR